MRKIRWTREVKFHPWVDEPYWDSPVRTLILGDSHYDKLPERATTLYTSAAAEEHAIRKPIAFFTKGAGIVENRLLFGESERELFWSTVAFYNYLQTLAGDGPRMSVECDRYADSAAAFREVLRKLQPNLIVVLGHRTWNWMTAFEAKRGAKLPDFVLNGRYRESREYPTVDGNMALAFHVKHPSTAFNFREFHPLYRAARLRMRRRVSVSLSAGMDK